jgi:hypothetical protein
MAYKEVHYDKKGDYEEAWFYKDKTVPFMGTHNACGACSTCLLVRL